MVTIDPDKSMLIKEQFYVQDNKHYDRFNTRIDIDNLQKSEWIMVWNRWNNRIFTGKII
jgi:hypothetical protein